MANYTMRRFLLLRELIHRSPDPMQRVLALLKQNPAWDSEETRSWEGWKAEELPEFQTEGAP